MLRTAILSTTLLVALAMPAAASCVVLPDGDAKDYPKGQEALLLCQQRALSDAVDDAALAERLRAMAAQLERLRLEQQRLQMRPIRLFDVPRF
jgi:TolA-binding protein